MNTIEIFKSSETIYNGRILTLCNDTVVLPNEKIASREVVKHSGGVCVLPLTDSGEIVMVRQFRYPFGAELLEIPAGKLEVGEEPLQCGKRELLEETGYKAEKFEFLGKLYPTPAYCTEIIYMYLARGLSAAVDSKTTRLDEDEFLNVEELPFEKTVDMVLANEIADAKTQLAILKTKEFLRKN
jgi:ADP-ribose pyrophosphatase